MLRRAVAYSDKVFALRNPWRQVRDFRPQPQIPTHVFRATSSLMFLCRLPSFNELEQYAHQPSWRRWLGRAVPSVDEIAYVSERIGKQCSRSVRTRDWT